MVIYPSRSVEQFTTKVPSELFASSRILPVYLDELGEIEQLSLGLGLMVLTTLEGDRSIYEAKRLLERSSRSVDMNGILELVSTIMVYEFTELSREEVDALLGYKIDEFKQTRVYQDTRQEGLDEGRREIVLMLLNQKFGELSLENQAKVQALDFDRLKSLSTALLGFNNLMDLENWF